MKAVRKLSKRKKRLYLFLGISFLLVCVITFINYHYLQKEEILAELSYCVDGDTMIFEIKGEEVKVRLLAVDAPELSDEYGKQSREFSRETLEGSRITLVREAGEEKDKYNRDLYWVYADGELLQELLLREGLAKIDYVYSDYSLLTKLKTAENEAKREKRGIWAE